MPMRFEHLHRVPNQYDTTFIAHCFGLDYMFNIVCWQSNYSAATSWTHLPHGHDQYIVNGILGPHHPRADSFLFKRSL